MLPILGCAVALVSPPPCGAVVLRQPALTARRDRGKACTLDTTLAGSRLGQTCMAATASPDVAKPRRFVGLPIAWVVLTLLVVQNSATALMVASSRRPAADGAPLYLGSAAVFLSECLKLPLCLALIAREEGGVRPMLAAVRRCLLRVGDTAKMAVPALCYLLQNRLLFVSLSRLSADEPPARSPLEDGPVSPLAACPVGDESPAVVAVQDALHRALLRAATRPAARACAVARAPPPLARRVHRPARRSRGQRASRGRVRPGEQPDRPFLTLTLILILIPTCCLHRDHNLNLEVQHWPSPCPSPRSLLGVAAVLSSSLLSGFANIYFEKAAHSHGEDRDQSRHGERHAARE